VELAVRKLLVASQQGGVGKTTTAINLAAAAAQAGVRVLLLDADPLSCISAALNLPHHPRRQPLRQTGLELPGVLVGNVVPGLDIVSPYEDGSCSDADLDDLFKVLASADFAQHYGCLIVGAPPFMGGNAGQLLGSCDEFVIAMRTEAMAYRTLPAFLQLVERHKNAAHPIQLRGIVLTLPEPDAQGDRWERELRGRFGTRVLPTVIPYDEAIRKALDAGRTVLEMAPEAPASQQYVQLAEVLELTNEAKAADLGREAPLLEVAAAMQAAGLLARHPVAVPVAVAVGASNSDTVVDTDPPVFAIPLEPSVAAPPPASGGHRMPPKSKVTQQMARPKSAPLVTPPPSRPRTPVAEKKDDQPVEAIPVKKPPKPKGGQPTIVWIGIVGAIIIGLGLRFVPLMPDSMMPLVVGALVTSGVILALKLVLVSSENSGQSTAEGRRTSGLFKKPSRPEVKHESRTRIAALARQNREQRLKRNRNGQ
jgi:chromosome partitioning protein